MQFLIYRTTGIIFLIVCEFIIIETWVNYCTFRKFFRWLHIRTFLFSFSVCKITNRKMNVWDLLKIIFVETELRVSSCIWESIDCLSFVKKNLALCWTMDTRDIEILDKSSLNLDTGSFGVLETLEQSCHMPDFEFSSPISSINSSNCSSPDRDHTFQPRVLLEQLENHINSSFVSLEELNSQISPPSDGSGSSFSAASSSTLKNVEVLETIYEDCYLETPPGTPTSPIRKKARKMTSLRISLARQVEFEEMKENLNVESCITNDEDDISSLWILNKKFAIPIIFPINSETIHALEVYPETKCLI